MKTSNSTRQKISRIFTLGPACSDSYQAAAQYAPEALITTCNTISDIVEAVRSGEAQCGLVPVYNTREGEEKEFFRLAENMADIFWVDNVVLPIHLSLGIKDISSYSNDKIQHIIGSSSALRQSAEYIQAHFPNASLVTTTNISETLYSSQWDEQTTAIIETEKLVEKAGFQLVEREVVSHNRTRFAVLGPALPSSTGYDATTIITKPLDDRVGLLVDMLNEFSRRGINILDLRSENDIKTQKLQIYLELEGHLHDERIENALTLIEKKVIQSSDSLNMLGSFPRVDMRVKQIKSFGFIGSGAMSKWFADRLENEGYSTITTGRTTATSPETMIPNVDVIVICVPISATSSTIEKFGPLLNEGQALILLAGESEHTLQTAIDVTRPGVEVMLVHNLWGPQAETMKDKNVSVVRTQRSGSFCSEFEAFLYKHGAEIYHDSPIHHDLLMGVGQKLPTIISVALAKTLKEHQIKCEDISSHSTLTSIYGILSMVRVHNQNARTYAEIMSTGGEGRKIVRSFVENIELLMNISENGEIKQLCDVMEESKQFMSKSFLNENMRQAKAVDTILGDSNMKETY